MAEITWEQIDVRCGDDDNIAITVRELTDGVPTVVKILEDGTEIHRTYTSEKFHKNVPMDKFKEDLKEKILADRSKTVKVNAFTDKVDLSGFEAYINQ